MADISEYGPPLRDTHWPRPGSKGAFGYGRSATHTHQGVDLRGSIGTPFFAVADGEIVLVVLGPGPGRTGMRGYGRCCVLRHVDVATSEPRYFLYAHASNLTVVRGQHVTRGHELGKVGNSQFAAHPTRPEGTMGPHLHLECSTHAYPQGPEAQTRLNPMLVLGGAPPTVAEEEALPAKRPVREALAQRVRETDARVRAASARMRQSGSAALGDELEREWAAVRAILWPLIAGPSRLAQIRAAVVDWLERIDAMGLRALALIRSAAALPEALRSQALEWVIATRNRLRAIWTAGIDWAEEQLHNVFHDITETITGQVMPAIGASVLLGLGLWWWSRNRRQT